MPLFGKIVVIKRNGADGTHFPLTANSCLFGRKKECDIRIQLPQVSKEHCKIEVNENKEATLINLSMINPTQLNGSIFQHPTYLKHKDVLTIIDRSFRFEYPPLSVPRKRHSTSQEKETLQVLHIQQVDQEELLHQNSECKSLQTPDKKLEWEGQNTHGSDKQKTEERTTRLYGTPESMHKTRRSSRKNGMSPFSKLYDLMKNEGERQTAEKSLSNEIPAQQKEYLLRKDGNDHLTEVATQTPHMRSAYDQTKKTEAVIPEEVVQCRETENQGINSVVCSPVSVEGNNSRKSSASLQTYATEKKLGSEETTDHINFQNIKENELEKPEVLKNDESLRANKQSTQDIPKSCCIVSLRYSDGAKSIEQPTDAKDVKIKSSLTDTSESDGNSIPTSKSKGKSIQIYASPNSREVKISSSKSSVLPIEVDSLLDIFSPTESSVETEGSSVYVNTEEHTSNIFDSNMFFKIKENNTSLVTEQPLDPEIPKETKHYTCSSDTCKDENSGIIACSPCHRRSPRRNMKQNKDFSNGSYFKDMLTEKELLQTPTSVSPGHDRTPNQLCEQTVGEYWPQKNDKKERAAINHEQDFVIKNNIQGPSNLTESSPKSTIQMPSTKTVSEMTVSSPLKVNREAGVKKSPLKRKNRESDLLNQPFGKRKRVSFGGHLSPELFDKRLPPNSPLKRGAIPARLSLPFGNSPRAVLKKASELGQSASKHFSERKHENILLKKAASPPARRSPAAASPPARRSPAAASPPARRSPAAASPPARRSPAAASPPARRSPAAASPSSTFSCNSPQRRGRFSVSLITSPSSSAEQGTVTGEILVHEDFTEAKTPEHSEHELKAARSIRRSKKFSLKRNSLHRRSGAMDAIRSKQRSGASGANLIVAKSWAEVVKQGVPKSQRRITTKCGLKRTARRITAKPRKTNVSLLKTPARKVKGYFTTGHANSPAPIVIGKAHTRIVKIAAQAPKMVVNYPVKHHCDLNESFTGMADMFNTPLNWEQKRSMSSVEKTNMPTPEVSALHTSEYSGELTVPSFTVSSQQRYNQDVVSPFLRETSQMSSLVEDRLKVTPRGGNTEEGIEEILKECSSLGIAVNETLVGVQVTRKSTKQKPESEVFSGIKTIMRRTPRQKPEPVEALSGVKRIMRTPKQKPEPVEALSGVKRIMRTPKQKPEPVEALSGVKRIMRTPKQKPEPVEALSGVKRIMRTPKQKPEPVEALSGVKRIMRTPKQNPEPVKALSGVMRAESKMEVFEDETACSTVLETPEEALSGVKRIMRTPKQNPEPVKALSGVMRAESKMEVFADETACSTVLETSEEVLEEILGSVTQKTQKQPNGNTSSYIIETPKEKVQLMEDAEGSPGLLRTPKQRFEPVEEIVGIGRRSKTPRQMCKPVDDYLGLQKFMAEPKQSYFSPEIDYTDVKEMMDIADEYKVKLPELANLMEEHESHMHSRSELEFSGSVPENEEFLQEMKMKALFERKSPLAIPKDNSRNDSKVEDSLERIAFSSPNELKIGADVGSIEIVRVSENSQPVGIDLQNGTIIDAVKSSREGSLGIIDAELLQPSVSPRRTRRGKGDKSSSAEACNTKTTRRHARNICSAKTTNCMQANENSNQNVTETRAAEESEMTKRPRRGKSRQCSAERNMGMESVNIMQTQEPSKETLVQRQQSVKRRVAAKGHWQADASLNSKEIATTKENGSRLITKASLRSRNRKDDKNELKSEFTKINSQDKMQCRDLEHSEMEFIRNYVFERNTRGERGSTIQTGTEKDQFGSLEFIAHETYGMESNQIKIKENLVRKKDRKVHFLLEEHNSVPLEEKCMVGDESVAHEEKNNAFFESSSASTKDKSLRRSKRKASVASLPVCISPTRKHVLTEICKVEQKEGINLPLEHITFVKDDSLTGSSSFAQEKCSQEIQTKGNPNEILGNVQIPIDHSPAKQRKVTKKKPLKRGQSKQAISHETSTEYGHNQEADTEDQNMAIAKMENKSKRGRGRRIAPVTQVSLPLENILAKESLSTDSFPFAQATCSLQYIKNENNPTEIQNVSLENAQASVEDNASKRQKVTQDYPLRRGRSKHAVSHETTQKCDDKESADIKDQNVVVKNVFSTKENPSKRGRGRRVASISQTPFSPLKNDHFDLPSSTNSKSTEGHNNSSEIAEFATANGSLSRRGRRRKTEDIHIASSVSASKRSRLLDNDNQEKVPEDLQGVTKDNVTKRRRRNLVPYEISAMSNDQPGNDSKKAITVKEENLPLENGFGKENKPKRGRGKNNVLASEVPPSLKVSITLPSAPSVKGETVSENQSMLIREAIEGEKLANRSKRNNKIVPCSTSGRRRCKVPEEIFQEKQNVDLEKTAVSNEKQSRRGRRKVDAPEATVSIALKEKRGLTRRGVIISEDQHVILENTISDLKGALMGTQRKVHKGKNLKKISDPNNIYSHDKNSNLGLQVLPENGNSSKRDKQTRVKQTRVNSEPESSITTLYMKKTFFTDKSSKPTAGNTESTTLKRGKRKMREHHITAVVQPTVEMESKTRASRRTRK